MKGQEVTSKALAWAMSLAMATSMTPSAAWALVESAGEGSAADQPTAQTDQANQQEPSEEDVYDAPVIALEDDDDVALAESSDVADPVSVETESNLVALSADDGVAVQSADALQSAVKAGFPLTLTTNSPDAWTQDASEEGRVAAKGAGTADATLKVSGEGWIIFDWKMDNGVWRDTCTLTVDGVKKGNIGANSSSDRQWKTYAVQVTGDEEHEITWSSVGSSSVYLSNVRVATSKTQVSASGEQVSTTITLGGDEVSSVAPGSKVTFTAVPAEGYVFAGWKASAQDKDYLATTAAYEVTVYDDPVSLIAVVEKPFAGSGTEAAPFEVSSKEDLQKIADYVKNGNSFSGSFFKLTGNIDFAGSDFEGIGSSKSFSGTFDGAGNAISGIKTTNGLFGKVSDATIKNLTVDGTVAATSQFAGMIVGLQSSGLITDCVARGTITTSEQYVGGIVGKASGNIENCTSGATVQSTYSSNTYGYVGGIVGQSQYDVKGCVNSGEVSAPNANNVGGIVGSASMLTKLDGCFNYGNVSGKSYVGGVLGNLESSTQVRNCASRGNVTAVNQAGGVVGYSATTSGNAVVDSCYATGDIASTGDSANSFTGGIVGYMTKRIDVTNCLSLVRSVDGKTCGRIGGSSVADQWNGAPVMADDYGLSTTLINGEVPDSDLGADAINGADITPEELYGDTIPAPMDKWSADAWSVAAGQFPVLKSVSADVQAGFPDYVVKPVVEHVKDALADGAALDIAANNNDLWTTETDGDRTYAVGAQGATLDESAAATVTVNGSGWLIFDWKATGATWQDKLSYTGLSYASGANNIMKWTTVVVPVTGDGDHAITIGWSAVSGKGTAKFQLDNVRFATEKTALNIAAAKGCEDMLDISVSENPATPGSKVTVTATPKSGYVFTGWKAAESDADFASTSQTLTVSVYDQAVSYVAYAEKPFEGAGTAEDPYQISSASDLNKLDAYTQAGNTFAGCTLKLTGDIAISGADAFTGVSGKFEGTFDGANHAITGSKAPQGIFKNLQAGSLVKDLTVEANAESSADNSGIIVSTSAGTIRNCMVKGALTSSAKYVGGIVGNLGGNGIIESCVSTAKVTCTSSSSYQTSVGGVAGTASYSTAIKDCQVGGSVDGGASASGVGGVIGRIASTTAVSGCYVTATVSGKENVGGIAGEYASSGSDAGIENCAFDGFVSGGKSVGGIAGKVEANSLNAKVRYNLALGKVSATGDYAGGILGSVSKPATIEGNVSLVESVSGTTAARVIGANVKPSWGSEAVIGDNCAYAGTQVNGAAAADDSAANSLDGLGVSAAELFGTDVTAAYGSWASDAWTLAAGKCPLIKAVSADAQQIEYPLYIKVPLAEMTSSISNVTYTGQVAAPELTFAMGSLSAKGDDFSITYQNAAGESVTPIAAGDYKAVATASGEGRFTGSAAVDFKVLAADMSSVDAKAIPSQNYTGAALEPQLQLSLNGMALTANDYDVAYFDAEGNPVTPIAVGAYKVVVTGKGNFTGTKELSFSIASESLDKAVVGAVADVKYTGDAIKPVPMVTLNGVVLSADDFDVSYEDAAGKQIDPVEVGTYAIVATGKGNYAGKVRGTFNIAKADGMVATAQPATAAYDGKGHTIGAVSAKGAKGEDLSGISVKYFNEQTQEYDLDQAPELTNVGTMVVKFKVSQANYNDATGQASVTVSAADGMVAASDPATATFDGAEHTVNAPEATANGQHIEGAIVKYFNEETQAYDLAQAPKFENVGTYTVKFQVSDPKGNYKPAEGVAMLTIDAAAIDQASIAKIDDVVFTGSAASVSPKATFAGKQLVEGQDYEISYADEQGQPIEPVSAGTYKVVLTGRGNFVGTVQANFSVVAASIEKATVKPISDLVYTAQMQKPVPEVELAGVSLTAGVDFDVAYQDAQGNAVNPINVGSYTIVVTGKGNYAGEARGSFAITKADGMTATANDTKWTYDGLPQTIGSVSVVANGRALENVTVKYFNEQTQAYDLDAAPTQTNVGELTVRFRVSHPNYNDVEGQAKVTVSASNKMGAQADNVSVSYDGADHSLGEVRAIAGSAVVDGVQVKYFNEESGAYDLDTCPTFKTVGTYTVKFQVTDPAGNYLPAENSATLTIAAADISSASVKAIGDVVYTGKSLDVSPSVSFAGSDLEGGIDYDVTFETAAGSVVTPTSVGSYVAVITGKGNFAGTARIGFNVVAPTVVDPATGVIAQGTIFADAALQGGSVKLEVEALGQRDSYLGNIERAMSYKISLFLLDEDGNKVKELVDDFGDLTLSFPVGSEYEGFNYYVLTSGKSTSFGSAFGSSVSGDTEQASSGVVTGGLATATVQSMPDEFVVMIEKKAEEGDQGGIKTDSSDQGNTDGSTGNNADNNSGASSAGATAQTGDAAATAPLAATAGIAGLIAALAARFRARRQNR